MPAVADRIARMVVKQLIETDLDQIFLEDSHGYRPKRSALDAVGVTRKRCWKYDWVLEFEGLQDLARQHGFVPNEWVIEDEGHSGATLIRPGLEKVRDLAAEGQIDAVFVYSPDRLSRKFAARYDRYVRLMGAV